MTTELAPTRAFRPTEIGPEHLGANGDDYAVLENGMTPAGRPGHASERHTVIDRDVVAHNRSLADHDAGAVINEKASANSSPRDGCRCW